jgi:hypothetical protein
MKFSGVLKFVALASVAGVLTLTLFGCGAAVSNTSFTQGNWAFTATSTAAAIAASSPTFVLGGNLTQSGATLSGTLSVGNSLCISPQTLSFTGTVKGSDITLTSQAFDGNVISVTASGTKDSLSGNYTITGGCADKGTITAGAVPSISGTWNGTISNGGTGTGISVVLTQSATASQDGTFALTGTLTYSGSDCTAPSTLTASSVTGNVVSISADSGFLYGPAALDSITSPKNMTGSYDNTSDPCAATDGNPVTLTKQ